MKVNKKLWRLSRLVHIYAAIALLIFLVFFSVTGITLNHADWFSDQKTESQIEFMLQDYKFSETLQLSPAQARQLRSKWGVSYEALTIEQDGGIAFIDAQKAGGFISAELNLETGLITGSATHYGIWAWANDLHKGRHTGVIWNRLIDITATLILFFCFSGLILLLPNKRYLRSASLIGAISLGAGIIITSQSF